MKTLTTPPRQDFDVYIARPETRWVKREETDSLESLYAQGFLPYSGATGVQDIFYQARSARIVLPQFELTSENRRIAKKFDGHFQKKRVADFMPDEAFFSFCLEYFAQKHGPGAMPRERMETILGSGLVKKVMIYHNNSIPVAYVLEIADGAMAHYWFSFYDIAYARQSLGLWLMLDAIRDAQARGLEYYYLGTVYGPNALYKTNFSPLQWWNGEHWSDDTASLKNLARRD